MSAILVLLNCVLTAHIFRGMVCNPRSHFNNSVTVMICELQHSDFCPNFTFGKQLLRESSSNGLRYHVDMYCTT